MSLYLPEPEARSCPCGNGYPVAYGRDRCVPCLDRAECEKGPPEPSDRPSQEPEDE